MLEATSAAVEDELKIDFANIYKESHLHRWASSWLSFIFTEKTNKTYSFSYNDIDHTFETSLISCFELLFIFIGIPLSWWDSWVNQSRVQKTCISQLASHRITWGSLWRAYGSNTCLIGEVPSTT